jgi:hypothetical protein
VLLSTVATSHACETWLCIDPVGLWAVLPRVFFLIAGALWARRWYALFLFAALAIVIDGAWVFVNTSYFSMPDLSNEGTRDFFLQMYVYNLLIAAMTYLVKSWLLRRPA